MHLNIFSLESTTRGEAVFVMLALMLVFPSLSWGRGSQSDVAAY